MQVVTYQRFPALISKRTAGNGKSVRQKFLDVVVEQLEVDFHPPGFQPLRLRVYRGIAYMRRKFELHFAEIWQVATRLRHGLPQPLDKPTDHGLAIP